MWDIFYFGSNHHHHSSFHILLGLATRFFHFGKFFSNCQGVVSSLSHVPMSVQLSIHQCMSGNLWHAMHARINVVVQVLHQFLKFSLWRYSVEGRLSIDLSYLNISNLLFFFEFFAYNYSFHLWDLLFFNFPVYHFLYVSSVRIFGIYIWKRKGKKKKSK